MSFQRSYSKVWWGSDNQLPAMTSTASSSLTGNRDRNSGGGCFSFYSRQQQPQQQEKQQQQPQQQQPQQQQKQFNFNTGHQHQQLFQSLDSNFHFKSYSGNLSRIQEVDDEHNSSKLSWEKRDSPGSLRSQDSGFSDNDESHSTRSHSRATTTNNNKNNVCSSPSTKSQSSSNRSIQSFGSPSSRSEREVATPPTVIRRVGNSEFYSPLVSVSRRISFSGSPASAQTMNKDKQQKQQRKSEDEEEEGGKEDGEREEGEEVSYLIAQLDSMHLVEDPGVNFEDESPCKCSKQRRRRRVSRKSTTPLSTTSKRNALPNADNNSSDSSCDEGDDKSEAKPESLDDTLSAYNNETVYLGEAPPPYNNETVILGDMVDHTSNNTHNDAAIPQDETMSPLKEKRFLGSTSTPKRGDANVAVSEMSPAPHYDCHEYANPLLNGHTPALQSWIGDLRSSYEHEVMSTLQTKSIAAEAFKNLTITTNTVAKLIRQLQQRATHLQLAFERMQRILLGEQSASLAETFGGAQQLVADVAEFSQVLERRAVFFTDSRDDRRRYEQNIEQIQLIAKDTRISLEKQHYINLESLLEDLEVLKRCLLVTLRLVFEKLVRVIVQSIEHGRCDLMLRANINMIATLTNIDYDGFASLTDAFVRNEAVRALLMVCLEHRLSAVRALALRALATICCAPAAIEQLGACGGVEVLRDILQVAGGGGQKEGEHEGAARITDMERREAVSLLTQITAAWHGPEHRVDGLRDAAETIVEGLTALVTRTGCAQTLLLCAAALNNLSRMEVTSHYSIMSHEAIFKWIETAAQRKEQASIFLYEQIASMLHNMSLNKKCHSHLANGSIINFITSMYQGEFYRVYDSRAQRDSQRRTIKAILHTLTRLVHESSLGPELLELQGIPVFLRTALVSVGGTPGGGDSNQSGNRERLRESVHLEGAAENSSSSGGSGKSKFLLSRQESYV